MIFLEQCIFFTFFRVDYVNKHAVLLIKYLLNLYVNASIIELMVYRYHYVIGRSCIFLKVWNLVKLLRRDNLYNRQIIFLPQIAGTELLRDVGCLLEEKSA